MSGQQDPATIQPPLDYSNDGPGIIIGCTILAAVSTVFVGARFWARKLTRQPFGWDDWLCVAALLVQHVLMAAVNVMVTQGGLGRDNRITVAEDPNSVVILFQGLFVGEIAYTFASPLIKLSVLLFYRRIFPTPAVKAGVWVMGVACLLWFIPIFILDFVQCIPLEALWFQQMQALATTKCLDPILCFLANSIANCIIDFFTLVLPIREVMKLHTSTRRKLNIGCVFLLGSIAFAASLVRTVSTGAIWTDGITNFTKQFVVSGVATVVEIYVAIIGACLPTLVPIYLQFKYGDPLKRTRPTTKPTAAGGYGSSALSSSGATGHSKASRWKSSSAAASHGGGGISTLQSNGSFERLADTAADHGQFATDGYVGSSHAKVSSHTPPGSRGGEMGGAGAGVESYPLEGVRVTRDTSTVWTEGNRGYARNV